MTSPPTCFERDNDTDRYELDRSIQASRRGGRTKSPGSKPIDQNGLPVCVLPNRSPCPGSRDPKVEPGRSPNRAVSCLETRKPDRTSPNPGGEQNGESVRCAASARAAG